jgi:hypothetical protein
MLQPPYARNQSEAKYPRLWDGLVGAWCPSINQRGGEKLFDRTRLASHCTLTNFTLSAAWADPAGLTSDGSNDYCDTGVSISSGIMSLSAWLKCTSSKTYNLMGSFDGAQGVWFGSVNDTQLWCRYGNGISTNMATVSMNVWHHFAVCGSGTSAAVYMDGDFVGTVTGTLSTSANLFIAAINSTETQYCYGGATDDVQLRNFPMLAGQVKSLYQLGPGGIFEPRDDVYGVAQQAAAQSRLLRLRREQMMGAA